MSEQIANEMRTFMEQTNQTLISQNERIEKTNQALLQALQNMGNSINGLKNNSANVRDTSSNHSENNGSSTPRVPKPPFLPREEIPRVEEESNPSTNSTEDIARTYVNLEPEIKEL